MQAATICRKECWEVSETIIINVMASLKSEKSRVVIPAEAGIQSFQYTLDPRLRGDERYLDLFTGLSNVTSS